MESESSSNREKKQKVFEEWMEGDHVLVQLDARHEGVRVPSHLEDNAALTLKLSYRFQGTTTTDEIGVTTYLRFAGDYAECVIPWDAVWGVTSSENETKVWTEDVPKEVLLQIACSKISDFGKKLFTKSASEDEKMSEEDPNEESRPAATLVAAQPLAETSDGETQSSSKVHRKKPNLKLIK